MQQQIPAFRNGIPMENNDTDKRKKEADERLRKKLDQRLQDLKLKLKEQKAALEKFLERIQDPNQKAPDEKENDQ